MPLDDHQVAARLVQSAAPTTIVNKGGTPIVFALAHTTNPVTGDYDWTMPGYAFRVIDAWFLKTNGAGGAAHTWTLQNAANPITNALDTNVADNVVVRAGTILDGFHEFISGGTMRVAITDGGPVADRNGLLYVEGCLI